MDVCLILNETDSIISHYDLTASTAKVWLDKTQSTLTIGELTHFPTLLLADVLTRSTATDEANELMNGHS